MRGERALLYCAGGGIGDSLIASVVARALRTRYASVDALTLPAHLSTLERVPDIARLHVDDGEESSVAAKIAQFEYAACVVTWATARTAHIAQLAKIPIRVGQTRRLYSYRFTERVPIRSELGNVTSHWSDILLDYARALGCDTDNRIPGFVPTAADERAAQALIAQHGLSKGGFMIVHPANAVASKRGMWPVAGWASLARQLRTHFATTVVVTGTSADAAIVRKICEQSGAIDAAGATGIGAFAALARASRAYVGITTGSMHIAAAVGAPTVGIFPFQSDFPERWAPLGASTVVVRPSYPCHAHDTKETCPDYACIANLNFPRILAATAALDAR